MVTSCSVNGCKNKHTKESDIRFHRYPKDETLRQKWLDSVNEKWFCPSKSSVVCSKHFLDTDYVTNIWGNKCLKPEAIPKRILSVSRCLLNDYGQTDSSVNNITEEPKLQSTDEPLMSCEFLLQSTPKRKLRHLRYLGDFTEEDLETPRKRKMFWTIYKKQIKIKNNTEKALRQQNQRLRKKNVSLNALVVQLQSDNKISANCSNILKVLRKIHSIIYVCYCIVNV